MIARPVRALQPNALYTVELPISSNPRQGFWAYDLAPLEAGEVPLRFSFSTGSGPSAKSVTTPASTESCDTMTQGPLTSCASCHFSTPGDAGAAAPFPPMGLDLSSARGLHYTAIAKVAHQAETANSIPSSGSQTPVRFGVQMNIVDPGNPATSYLMYKLLQKPENFRLLDAGAACPIPYHSPVVEGGCTPPDTSETERLQDWFVQGDPMPKNGRTADGAALPASTDYASLRRIADWITAGASCPIPTAPPPK